MVDTDGGAGGAARAPVTRSSGKDGITMDDFGFSYDYGFGYDSSASNYQAFDDTLTGNDPTTYDSLSNFQAFDDVLTDNQGYGWDTTDDSGGTIWATGDASADENNFGY